MSGLWLKRDDGTLVPVGSGGASAGEHVLTGDPAAPPAELEVGQLLWDGNSGEEAADVGPYQWFYDGTTHSVPLGGSNVAFGQSITFGNTELQAVVVRVVYSGLLYGDDGPGQPCYLAIKGPALETGLFSPEERKDMPDSNVGAWYTDFTSEGHFVVDANSSKIFDLVGRQEQSEDAFRIQYYRGAVYKIGNAEGVTPAAQSDGTDTDPPGSVQ